MCFECNSKIEVYTNLNVYIKELFAIVNIRR